MNSITQKYIDLHNKRIEEFGLNEKALWSGVESQRKRFNIIKDVFLEKHSFSILDLGCGFGDFLPYIKSLGFSPEKYWGFDVNAVMIKEASERYSEGKFEVGSVEVFMALNVNVDYVVASGIYNLGENRNTVQLFFLSQFTRLFKRINKGFVVNFLSDKSPTKDQISIYHSAEELLELCKKSFSQDVKIVEGYMPNDFTIFVYK